MEEVKIMGNCLSLFCCRIEWGLKLKGIEGYEYIEEDVRNKSPMLLQYNPVHKKIPVLVHNGKPIAESLIILEYIDETWRQKPLLLPQDPFDKATVRFWARYVDEKCVVSAWAAFCAKGQDREKAIECAQESLKLVEKEIEGKKFFGGETVGLLDLVMGSLPNWLKFLDEFGDMKLFDAHKFPSLHQWFHTFTEITIFKERMISTDGLINHFRGKQLEL